MTLFNHSEGTPLGAWLAPVGAMLAALAASVAAYPHPAVGALSPSWLAAIATGYVLFTAASASVGAAAAFYAFPPPVRVDGAGVIAQFAAAAAWIAPVVLFVGRGHAWSFLAAAGLGIALAFLFRRFEQAAIGGHSSDPGRLRTFAAALIVQAALLAVLARSPAAAAVLAAAGCFLIAWWSSAYAPESRRFPPAFAAFPRLALTVGVAALLTMSGLFRYISRAGATTETGQQQSKPGGGAPDLYSGIVLLPPVPRHAKLVPPVPQLRRNPFAAPSRNTFTVPFSGEYWIFHWPQRRPPQNAMVAHGAPTEFKFTAQGTALIMQARQRFDPAIPVSCCSAVALTVRNTDPMPETVELEIVLVNNMLPDARARSQSLGRLPATAVPLRFTIPPGASMGAFDELIVIFHLDPGRIGRSANIAVENFSFLPRV